jgi:rhomboid protease GluP
MPVLYRIAGQWEELLEWEVRQSRELERMPQLLHVRLRARGEVGDLRGLVEMYDQHQAQIGKLTPVPSRDLCRLMLFAFCGKRAPAERLFAGSLSVLPATTQRFWLATADLAAGDRDAAKRELEKLLPSADAPMRLAIERRVARLSTPLAAPDAFVEGVIEAATLEQSHDDSFGARPTLFSKLARATQMLIVLNVVMFGAELGLGGSTNGEALYRLGALFPPAVRGGEWWRLVAAIFLHFGVLHLAMNMIALWMLGPFTEFALGFRRFLLIYMLTGIGSMGFVMAFASGPNGEQVTVGASGSVMGLIGATGALMLRGWWREKARAAQRRLIAMLTIVATQAAFDAVVPQVSMAAHLSGAVIGFGATLLLADRLRGKVAEDGFGK